MKVFHYTNMITPKILSDVSQFHDELKMQKIDTNKAIDLLKNRIQRRRQRLGFLRNLLIRIVLRYNSIINRQAIY